MRYSLSAALLLLASVSASAQPAHDPNADAISAPAITLPATAAGRAAATWLDAFNRADSVALRHFVAAHFAAEALGGRSIDALVTRERWRAYNLGPAEPVRVDAATDSSISVLVRHPSVDGWGHLTIRVASDSAHRITSVGLTRMEEPPVDLGPHGRLADDQIALALDQFVASLTADGRFAGAVGLVHDGRIVSMRAYGLANRAQGVPNTLETRFQLASVGKVFTTVTIAKLVEQGRLAYADPLGKWIPEYPNATAARTVTVAHLLTHSSGITDFFRNPEWERSDKAALAMLPLESHFRFFASDSLAFTPGTRTQYSNSGFLLLGIIAERAAKKPFVPLFAATAFRVAGMQDSWNPDRAAPRATGYTWYAPMRMLDLSGVRMAEDEPVVGTPAGGGISTICDMTRFAATLLDGRLISRASLDTLTARHGLDETPTSWAAYGFDGVELWRGERIANKSGNTYGAHTQFDIYPDAGYGVVVLSNLDSWASEAVVYKARELITRR